MKRMLTSCFGLGRLPVAPGTWGSLPVMIIFGLMCQIHLPELSISIVMAALALAGSVICVKFAPEAIAATGKNDPGEVVADELAGQAVTFLAVMFLSLDTLSTGQICITAVFGFCCSDYSISPNPGRYINSRSFPKAGEFSQTTCSQESMPASYYSSAMKSA